MDDLAARLLAALAEGYQARAEMKERNRALTEYEIARRAGLTEAGYAEFSETAQRDELRAVLDELERFGLVTASQRAGRYDAYVPTEDGVRQSASPVPAGAMPPSGAAVGDAAADGQGETGATGASTRLGELAALERITQQLDEVVRLLRAIDAKLERGI